MAKGFHQQEGVDFHETFSHVVKPTTTRVILTLLVTYRWDIQQVDINNKFLNGDIKKEVYMKQPPGFVENDSSLMCKLKKAMYGFKHAPWAWYAKQYQALLQFGFLASKCDHSRFVYQHNSITLYALVYVDVILVTRTSSKLVHALISKLHLQFALKKLGKPKYFLGLEVHEKSGGAIILTQRKYIWDLLTKVNMIEAKGVNTPMFSQCKLNKHGSDVMIDPHLYMSIVGALQYMTWTRPYITFSINKSCQFIINPLDSHWSVVKHILRYLSGTSQHGLLLQPADSAPHTSIRAYSDSDWASDADDRRSTSGPCVYLVHNLIS